MFFNHHMIVIVITITVIGIVIITDHHSAAITNFIQSFASFNFEADASWLDGSEE